MRRRWFRPPAAARAYGWLGVAGVTAGLVLLAAPSARALTTIVQTYSSASTLPVGTIVSLTPSSSDSVEAATLKNVGQLFGVTVPSSNAPISLSSGTGTQTEVATSGVEPALVSDINGAVNAGDEITASPIDGVGMKASSNVRVVGVAQESLAQSAGKIQQSVTDANHQKRTVILGQIPVLVNVAYFYKQPDKTVIPAALQNLANAIAGKTPSPVPIIISFAIFIVALVSIMSLVYSAIRSSIISVGRNPMSQSAVNRSLLQVTTLILFIMGGAVAAIYLILTRA